VWNVVDGHDGRAALFDYSGQPKQHPPPLKLLSLLYLAESTAVSMREMNYNAQGARASRAAAGSRR